MSNTPELRARIAALKQKEGALDGHFDGARIWGYNQAVDDVLALLAESTPERELLAEIAGSGVEIDHPALDYLTVQIDRGTWDRIRALTDPGNSPKILDGSPATGHEA